MRVCVLVALVGLSCIAARTFSERAAWAAPAAPEELEAARAHYLAGKAYFVGGNLLRALREFQAAAANMDLPELDYNLALTYDKLGNAARAIEFYNRYRARRPDDVQARELVGRVTELQSKVGHVSIVTTVPGATFGLDDEPLEASKLNAAFPVTAGMHRLVASKDGYHSRAIEIHVTAGQEIRVDLDPIPPQTIVQRTERVIVERPARVRWWIPVVVVGSVLVAGGAITAGVLASRTQVSPPYRGNVSPGYVVCDDGSTCIDGACVSDERPNLPKWWNPGAYLDGFTDPLDGGVALDGGL
jgi:hypothetical protein